jgi:exportin-T
VTPNTIPLLFTLLADPSLPIRLATSVVLLRIVSKGLKEPGDKLQLLKVLSLTEVIDALEAKTVAQRDDRGVLIDEGEETYREALGKLLNALGLELVKLTDVSLICETNARCLIILVPQDCPNEDIRAEANRMLNQILPVLIRFVADEYDDTSSTVFPLLQTILAGVRVCHQPPKRDNPNIYLS